MVYLSLNNLLHHKVHFVKIINKIVQLCNFSDKWVFQSINSISYLYTKIFIFHATKDGKFKGGNELAHEVDVIIEVKPGLAQASGRFNSGGELKLKN